MSQSVNGRISGSSLRNDYWKKDCLIEEICGSLIISVANVDSEFSSDDFSSEN